MTDIINCIFRRKKAVLPKMVEYGFDPDGSNLALHKTLQSSGFELTITVTPQGDVSTVLIDPAFDEIYTLHLTDSVVGGFVGGVRMEFEAILTDIAEKCFEPEIFKCEQTKAIIEYVRKRYGDELEYLWQKFPDNAVWRRKDNAKWYAAILTVSRRKLGQASDEIAEIIDLRYPPQEMGRLVDGKKYFPGWHMNKKSWYTIILDGSVNTDEVCRRIDESYILAKK